MAHAERSAVDMDKYNTIHKSPIMFYDELPHVTIEYYVSAFLFRYRQLCCLDRADTSSTLAST